MTWWMIKITKKPKENTIKSRKTEIKTEVFKEG